MLSCSYQRSVLCEFAPSVVLTLVLDCVAYLTQTKGTCGLQVAFMNDGSFLVSDGYCNSRVVRYNPDGSHHSQYKLPNRDGKIDRNPNSGGRGFDVAHSLVLDECDGDVMMADRENERVMRFNLFDNSLMGKQGAGCVQPCGIGRMLAQQSEPFCPIGCTVSPSLLCCCLSTESVY